MPDFPELDFRHHDFIAKWRSLTAALHADLGADATRAAINCVRLLRTPMWRQGFWRAFENDVDLAIAAAEREGLDQERDELLAYKAGLNEALGRWPQVARMARMMIKTSHSPAARATAAFQLGTALHYLGRPCEGARILARAFDDAVGPAQSVEILHKYHRMLRAVARPRAARRLLQRIIGRADEWLRAEMLLDMASLERARRPGRALECISEARHIYLDREFARGLAYSDLEEGLVRLRLGEGAAASALIHRAEDAFIVERYSPGQAHAAYARALLARRESRRSEASALFHASMTIALELGYVNAAARAALSGLPLHLRQRHVGRALAATATLVKSSAMRGLDLLLHGIPRADLAARSRRGP